MSNQPKLVSLVNELGHATLYTPTITTIDLLSTPGEGFPKDFKLTYSQQNYRESATMKSSIFLTFDPSNQTTPIEEFPAFSSAENDVLTDSHSPSRRFRALFRKGADKVTLEVWTRNGLWKSLRVSDYHEVVYGDSIFCLSSIVWSEDEKRILYIAEEKEKKAKKYLEGLETEEEAENTFGKFEYKQELGEGYRGRKNPLVFVYEIEQETLSQVLNIPEGIIPTYVSFTDKEGKGILFCGLNYKDLKLGIRFCSNRATQLYFADKLILQKAEKKNGAEKQEGEKAKAEKESLRNQAKQSLAVQINQDAITTCPILSKDKTKVAYFFSPWKYTHTMAFGLKVLKLGSNQAPETIIDVIQEKRLNADFTGITGFVDTLSRTEWLNDRFLVINTFAGCSLAIFIVDTQTKEVRKIDQPKFKSEEWRLKNVYDNLIVSTISNMDGGSRIGVFSGLNLSAPNLEEAVRDAKWSTYELKMHGFDGTVLTDIEKEENIHEKIIEIDGIQTIFFGVHDPKNSQDLKSANSKRPLVMFLHGGPHATYTGISTVTRQYLLKKGYNLLMPNFTGSLGYGQKFVEDLAGKIGEIDVEEILKSLDYCAKEGLCDESKVAIFGGSYGGFLCGVLTAKYSEKFKCAIILNPAVNVNHLWETSDIPEWSPGEALNKDTIFDINSDEYKKMYDMSPVSMFKDKNVQSSILLMLGEKDKRVPYGSGLQFYNILRKKGADIRLLTYPEGDHSLAGVPEMEFDVLIQIINFINDKLGA